MPCEHRFLNQLLPVWELEYLFVGTFNPTWNYNNAEQADYFYGKIKNNFWCVLPRVFGEESLKREELNIKLDYIIQKKIGITDLVINIQNASRENIDDRNKLTKGFSDNVLNRYILEFNTPNILKLIENNKSTLQGVFLTRSTLNGIDKIAKNWREIEEYCLNNKIKTDKLRTPANYGGGCDRKSEDWANKILL
ncbi:hypothetical protein [Flavobacterium limnophilum]|uniref:hypothetical protein n=1 Tax=Flavobacterium limnophilum TaxID=3003262 RepID=UPI0022ABEE6E|nr:hypothetical protein [Flavobacterium limnophilum]